MRILHFLGGGGSLLLVASVARAQIVPDWVQENSRLVEDQDCTAGTCLLDLEGELDLVTGDVDRDGDLDVVIARKVQDTNTEGLSNMLLLNGGGWFADFTDSYTDFNTVVARPTRDIQLFDADGDGWLDMITVNTGDGVDPDESQPRLYKNKGEISGAWQGFELIPQTSWLQFYYVNVPAYVTEFIPRPRFCGVAAGDVEGDGDLDLFFVDYTNTLGHRLLLNQSAQGTDFQFVDDTDHPTDSPFFHISPANRAALDLGLQTGQDTCFTASVAMANLNPETDNLLDLVYWQDFACPGFMRVVYSRAASPGRFELFDFVSTNEEYAGAVLDYNDDGRPDFYTVSDRADRMVVNKLDQGGGLPDLDDPANGGILNPAFTEGVGGCTHSEDLDRDGYPDLGVADIDVKDFEGDCAASQNVPPHRFHVLINTTPHPASPNDPPTDPDDCTVDPHGEGYNDPPESWHLEEIWDFAFVDVNLDGFHDILFGQCGRLRAFVMTPFPSAATYCETAPNSVGPGVRIAYEGDLSVFPPSLTLQASGAPASKPGYFFYGAAQGLAPFGNGYSCIAGTTYRLPTIQSDGNGDFQHLVDFNSPPVSSGPGKIDPGSIWNFQLWYRDPMGGGAKFNLSDGLSVSFAP